MKILTRSIILVALALMLAIPVLAQAPAPGIWNTGFTVRNMSFWEGTPVYIEFYDSDGLVATTWEDELEHTSYVFLYSGNIDGLPEETSAAVFSDEPVAVVANLVSEFPDKTESAYVSMQYAETSAELFAPGIYKDYYGNSSAIRVMNVGDYTADVRVRFYAVGQSTPTCTVYRTLQAGAGYTFEQEDQLCLGSSFIGSAVIDNVPSGGEPDEPLAAITHITIDPGPIPGNSNPWRLHAIHNAIIEGDHLAYLPVLANNYHGNISAATVLNMRETGQWVRLSYSSGHSKTKYISGLSTALWYTPNEGPPTDWHGSGTVECLTSQYGSVTMNCEVVATVNQINEEYGNFASYNGFTTEHGQRMSHIPLVVKDYTDVDYTTTVTCQNVDDDWVAICIKLDGIPMFWKWVAAGASYSWYLGDEAQVPTGYNGSGYAYSYFAGEHIICLAQQNADDPSENGDWLTTYNGVSVGYP